MYDLSDSISGEFTTGMLVVAILLETIGLIVFGVVVGSLTTYITSGNESEVLYTTRMEK
eukprot:SAG31_NODE_25163_length_466_cov_7.626549_1_plen_58_part_10